MAVRPRTVDATKSAYSKLGRGDIEAVLEIFGCGKGCLWSLEEAGVTRRVRLGGNTGREMIPFIVGARTSRATYTNKSDNGSDY